MWKGKDHLPSINFQVLFYSLVSFRGRVVKSPQKNTNNLSSPLTRRDASVVRFCKWFLWRDMFCSLKIFIGRKDQKLHPYFRGEALSFFPYKPIENYMVSQVPNPNFRTQILRSCLWWYHPEKNHQQKKKTNSSFLCRPDGGMGIVITHPSNDGEITLCRRGVYF